MVMTPGFCALLTCVLDPKPWHGDGAAQLMKMAKITPKSYLCPRVKEKPDVSSGNVFSPGKCVPPDDVISLSAHVLDMRPLLSR